MALPFSPTFPKQPGLPTGWRLSAAVGTAQEIPFGCRLPEKDFPRVSNVVFPGYPFLEDRLAEPQDPDSVPAKTDGPPFDEVAFDQHSDGVDLAVGVPARFGIGYGLPRPGPGPAHTRWSLLFLVRMGRAIVVNDLDRQMTLPM